MDEVFKIVAAVPRRPPTTIRTTAEEDRRIGSTQGRTPTWGLRARHAVRGRRRHVGLVGPRPGNNPFSRKQGMHTPTPGDIPRPHPMNRPSVNNGEGRRGGRPGQGGGQRGGFRGRPGQGGAKPGQWGQHRPGQGGGQRPAGGGNRFGGNGGGFQGGNSAPSNGPARGGRGRGGAAGAFGRQEASPRRRVRTVWRSVRNSRR